MDLLDFACSARTVLDELRRTQDAFAAACFVVAAYSASCLDLVAFDFGLAGTMEDSLDSSVTVDCCSEPVRDLSVAMCH